MKQLTGLVMLAIVSAGALAQEPAEREGLWVEVYDIGQNPGRVPRLVGTPAPNVAKVAAVLDLADSRSDFGELKDNFLCFATGRLAIAEAGKYTLRLISDDGSILLLNGQLLIDNDGLHGAQPKDATLNLSQGFYQLSVQMFEAGGDGALRLEWQRPGSDAFEVVPSSALRCKVPENPATAPGVKPIAPRPAATAGDGSPLMGVNPGYDLKDLRPAGYEPAVAALAWDGDALVVTSADGSRTKVTGVMGEQTTVSPLSAGPAATAEQPVAALAVGGGKLSAGDQTVCLLPAEVVAKPMAVAVAPAGLFAGQAFVGDLTGGGVNRVFIETVDGQPQGTLFRFTQGLEAGPSALLFAPDGSLIVGGAEGELGKPGYGLQRLTPRDQPAFELKAVRARSDGLELEFTKPLADGAGWDPFAYRLTSWVHDATNTAAPRSQERRESVASANVSADRTKVFVETPDLQAGRVVQVRVSPDLKAADGGRLWSTEAWVTLNRKGAQPGTKVAAPDGALPNTLTVAERQAGWKLLFDGESATGWRGFRKEGFPAGWEVANGTLHHVKGGGDLITVDKFASFELQIDWMLTPGTNSGLMYRVSEEASPAWHSGPEIQILDESDPKFDKNSCGSMYDLYAPTDSKQVNPAGEWNHFRLLLDGDHAEHWLNGNWILSYTIGDADWQARVKASKFGPLPLFGNQPSGHLCLQDHGHELWFRNIKIRELPGR